jgi:predicted PurR-regulated permease PerM
MQKRTIELSLIFSLFAVMLAVVVFMTLPYLNVIVLAAVLAFLLSGVFERLARIIRSRSFAALILTLLVFIIILVPLSFAGYQIAKESGALYASLRNQSSGANVSVLLHRIQTATHSYLPLAQLDAKAISDQLQQVLAWFVGHLSSVFTGITHLIINFFFFLLVFYYLVRDGTMLKRKFMKLSPISDTHEQYVFDRIARSISGSVRGQVILSGLQGLVAGFGFAFFGVPNPALWGGIVVLTSFIPLVGTSLVIIPAILYLLAFNSWSAAIGLTLWGLLAVGLLDNWLGPRLVASGTRLHPLIAMVAVLGGIGMFGPIGLLLGPIIVSVLFALFDVSLALWRSGSSA